MKPREIQPMRDGLVIQIYRAYDENFRETNSCELWGRVDGRRQSI
jgi:hypothetical protein